jgi:hypothetical protein
MQARAQTVLPRFIAPPVLLCLWLLLGCCVGLGVLAWMVHVPVYCDGVATVILGNKSAPDEPIIVGFFPPEFQSEIKTGQNLLLRFSPTARPLMRTINVESKIFSPAEVQRTFMPADTNSLSSRGPSVIVIARLGRPDETVPASAYEGVVTNARIEVGSRRLISLVPVVGRLFKLRQGAD